MPPVVSRNCSLFAVRAQWLWLLRLVSVKERDGSSTVVYH